jgi:hypothetical protein
MDQEKTDTDVLHFTPDRKGAASSSSYTGVTLIWWFLGLVFVVFIGLLVIALRHQPQTQSVEFDPQSASILSSLSPEVSVKKPSQQSFQVIDASEPIAAGTEVTTGAGAQAVIFSGDGILTTLKENSRVVLRSNDNENNQTQLELLAGGLWARVDAALSENESYQVRAGDTVTSVRGTEFEIDAGKDSVSVAALRDEVSVQASPVNTPTRTASSTNLLSGQQASVATDQSSRKRLSVSDITQKDLRRLVQNHARVMNTVNGLGLRDQVAVIEEIPVLADDQSQSDEVDSQETDRFEEFGRSLYGTFFAQNPKKKARFHLLQAQKRLRQIDANKTNEKKLNNLLSDYQSAVVQASEAAERTNNRELQEMIAKATRLYTQNMSAIGDTAPDSLDGLFRQAKNITAASHRSAVNALSSTSPQAGFTESARTMNSQLAAAQVSIANGNERSVRDNLQEYDRFVRKNVEVSKKDKARLTPRFADQLRRNLSAFESSKDLNDSLSPGIDRTIDEVRNRTIDSQTAAIANMATSSPERAVEIYEKTTDYYIDRVSKTDNPEDVSESLDAVNKYSAFGSKVAALSDPVPAGTSTVQDQMQQVAKRQSERLSQVSEQVPEETQGGLKQAIENQKRIQKRRPVNPSSGQPDDVPGLQDNQEAGQPDDVPGLDDTQEPSEDVGPPEDTEPEDTGQPGNIPGLEGGKQEQPDNTGQPDDVGPNTDDQLGPPEDTEKPDSVQDQLQDGTPGSGDNQSQQNQNDQLDDVPGLDDDRQGQPDDVGPDNDDNQGQPEEAGQPDETGPSNTEDPRNTGQGRQGSNPSSQQGDSNDFTPEELQEETQKQVPQDDLNTEQENQNNSQSEVGQDNPSQQARNESGQNGPRESKPDAASQSNQAQKNQNIPNASEADPISQPDSADKPNQSSNQQGPDTDDADRQVDTGQSSQANNSSSDGTSDDPGTAAVNSTDDGSQPADEDNNDTANEGGDTSTDKPVNSQNESNTDDQPESGGLQSAGQGLQSFVDVTNFLAAPFRNLW